MKSREGEAGSLSEAGQGLQGCDGTWGLGGLHTGFPRGEVVKSLSAKAGGARDVGLTSGWGRSPQEAWQPLQCSRLENPMDRGAWGLQSMGSQRLRHDSN